MSGIVPLCGGFWCVMSAFVFGMPGLASARPEPREILHASDGNPTVWNFDSGLGGDVPDWITTVRWVDTKGAHDALFDEETGRLGWVEGIGVFETTRGPVYVLVSEDVRDPLSHALRLTAIRAADGELREAAGFFPPELPGTNESRSAIAWEYVRRRGSDAQRPIEAEIHEDMTERIEVRVSDGRGEGRFALELRGSALVAVGLRPQILEPFVSSVK